MVEKYARRATGKQEIREKRARQDDADHLAVLNVRDAQRRNKGRQHIQKYLS